LEGRTLLTGESLVYSEEFSFALSRPSYVSPGMVTWEETADVGQFTIGTTTTVEFIAEIRTAQDDFTYWSWDDDPGISLDEPSHVGTKGEPTYAGAPYLQLIRDADGDRVLDAGEMLAWSNAQNSIVATLVPGTYYLRIRPGGITDADGNSPYLIRTHTRTGLTTSLSRSLDWHGVNVIGPLRPARATFRSSVPAGESLYHRMTIEERTGLRATLGGLSGNATLSLIRDRDLDQQLDDGETLITSARPRARTEYIDVVLDPGTYYVRVASASTAPVSFKLDLAAFYTPSPEPGIGFTTAYNTLHYGSGRAYMDAMNGGDRRDFYRFEVSDPLTVNIQLQSFRGDANFVLLKDANNNGVPDQGELIGSSTNVSPALDQLRMTLDAGVYYIHVYRATETNATYQLTFG
jgi:hypothetical protein